MGVGSLNRAVFFDRDGVLNDAIVRDGVPHPPGSLEELRVVPSARRAVDRVREAGYLAVAITNQPDAARGLTSIETIRAINARLEREAGLDAVYTCFHDDGDECACRKPKPGLLVRAAEEHDLDLQRCYVIGDRVKDVECGRAAGCTTIFLDFHYGETVLPVDADITAASLDEAIGAILVRSKAGA